MASANQFRAEIWGVSHRHRPLRGDGEVPAATRASGAQRSVCASGWEGREEIGAEIIPKGVINLGQSLSHGCAVPAPFAQGSLRDGGCGLPRRPCGPPRNDNGFLSFRGAERRGNPSFLRWTGVRAAVPRAWPPPTKFHPEIWGVGQVVGPYGRSTEVPAVGRCGHRPLRKARSTTQASRRAAKRPRPQPRGMGGNRRKNHPKRRTAPATTQAALSEAESAERGAGQIRFLPDDLRVQHGAQCPEISAKPRPCSRRDHLN